MPPCPIIPPMTGATTTKEGETTKSFLLILQRWKQVLSITASTKFVYSNRNEANYRCKSSMLLLYIHGYFVKLVVKQVIPDNIL